jgi:colanic acid biosynthesis glycosyl transferase WcaI
VTTPGAHKRVVFVEQYYYPEGWGGAAIPRDITIHLSTAGYKVEVVCGSDPYAPMHANDAIENPATAGVKIVRIPRLFAGDIKRGRVIRQLWFYAVLVPTLLLRRPPDLYIAQTNPPLAIVLLTCFGRLFRVPLIIIAQDLYPESLIAHGLIRRGSLTERVLRAAFRWAYCAAAVVVVLGPVMHRRVFEKGVSGARIVEISNWATGSMHLPSGSNPLRKAWRLEGRFVLLYSGNLGIGHEFETLLDAVQLAVPRCPELRLVFVGKGGRLAEVRAGVALRGLSGFVEFRDFVSANELPYSLTLADFAVVTLRNGFEGLIVPSKFFGYMARGIPTLYIGPESDVSVFVERTQAGLVFRTGDAAAIADAIVAASTDPKWLERMSAAAHTQYREFFQKDKALSAYAATVQGIIGGGES